MAVSSLVSLSPHAIHSVHGYVHVHRERGHSPGKGRQFEIEVVLLLWENPTGPKERLLLDTVGIGVVAFSDWSPGGYW